MRRREFIASMAAAPALGRGRSSAAIAVPGNVNLAERAGRFHDLILQIAMGPEGMIIAFPLFTPRRPLQEGAPPHWYLVRQLDNIWGAMSPRPTVAEWLYGENTLWATGWFLWSQILRYQVTHEPQALETARKCFRDLSNIFRLCSVLEPGLLGKPHGGRAGATTSYDQSACPILFYVKYAQELATPEEKAEAVRNMQAHGEYYLQRNWVANHFGNYERIVDPAGTSTMKYLACVHAAYELTGDKWFRDAAFKYLRQIIQAGRLPWPGKSYEPSHNMFYWALLCDYWSKTEMAGEFDWQNAIQQYWQAARTALDGEGLHRFGDYDVLSHSFTPYPDEWQTRDAAWQALSKSTVQRAPRGMQRTWISATCRGNRALTSACTAALAFLVRSRGIDDQAHLIARKTLLRMDEDSLRWWWDDGKLPAEMKALNNFFAPEVAGVWQIAYWMGRSQNVLE